MLAAFMFLATNLILWRFMGAALMPRLLTERFFEILRVFPTPGGFAETFAFMNFAVFYFGAYFVFVLSWDRLKHIFRNPFLAAFALWCVNVLILFPLVGRGILGYKLPQGPFSSSILLFAAHWIFARTMQWRTS